MDEFETENLGEALAQLMKVPGVLGAVVASLPGGLVVAQAGNVGWWVGAFTHARMLEVAGGDVPEGRFAVETIQVLAISPTPLLLVAVGLDEEVEKNWVRLHLDRVARVASG